MPNQCQNTITIGATEEIINMLTENEFLFDKLRPLENHENHTCVEFWGTKWERTEYELLKKGTTGLEIRFNTAWNPPYELFNYLIEKHNIWIKCMWSEEGGNAGAYVGRKGKAAIDVMWKDWSIEEYAFRMGSTNTVKKEGFYQTF
jgi:hypothetical protein